jgi:hypothetical protein
MLHETVKAAGDNILFSSAAREGGGPDKSLEIALGVVRP